jgi:hypothetical protein
MSTEASRTMKTMMETTAVKRLSCKLLPWSKLADLPGLARSRKTGRLCGNRQGGADRRRAALRPARSGGL